MGHKGRGKPTHQFKGQGKGLTEIIFVTPQSPSSSSENSEHPSICSGSTLRKDKGKGTENPFDNTHGTLLPYKSYTFRLFNPTDADRKELEELLFDPSIDYYIYGYLGQITNSDFELRGYIRFNRDIAEDVLGDLLPCGPFLYPADGIDARSIINVIAQLKSVQIGGMEQENYDPEAGPTDSEDEQDPSISALG